MSSSVTPYLPERPDAIPLLARVAGIIRRPRTILTDADAAPRWAGVLLLTTLVTFACSAVLFRTDVGRQALVDQWERTALAFGGVVDDAQYARFQDLSNDGVAYAALSSVLSGPVLAIGVAAILTVVLNLSLKDRVTFQRMLVIAAHASVILALRQVVATPLNYASETLASPTTLVQIVSTLDESSPVARFLGAIDLFVMWWIVVLAIGVSVVYHRRVRPLALAFTGAYIVLAALLAIAMAISGGTA